MYDQETILKEIRTKWAGKTVHFAKETDSTNEWAKRLSQEGAPHGTLAVAEFQSAGKGRLGRRWQAPEGSSVMMSLLLKPEFEPGYASMLTVVMGLSVAQAMQKTGIEVSIKWPNDVVMSRRKICGILTEMGLNGTKIREVVIGVGINVNIMRRLSGPAAFPEWWKNIISFWQTGISLSVFLIRISPGRERPWELMNRESFW